MYGVIDIGSNTIRLVVYRVEDHSIQKMMNKKYMVGLAGYINKDNELTKSGVNKLVEVLKELQMLLESIVLEELYIFATASLRNIINTEETVEKIYQETGWTIQVLSGEEEARYDYYGMMHECHLHGGIVADVGGGSTELVFFSEDQIKKMRSIPVGSLTLYRKHVSKILPKPHEVRDIRKDVDKRLKNMTEPKHIPTAIMCCVGGSARAAQKLLRMKYKNAVSSNGYDVKYLERFLKLFEEKEDEVIQMLLRVCPERLHTILPGIIVLQRLAQRYSCKSIITLENGVREGYLLSKLDEGETING